MSLSISTGLNEARLQGVANYIDSGSGAAYFAIYGGTRPANVDIAPGTAPLAQITLADPCGTVASNALTLTPGVVGPVTTSGVATWARLFNGNGDAALDCDCSATGGTGELKLSNVTLYAGAEVSLTSAVFG